jgi:uncharacterized protein
MRIAGFLLGLGLCAFAPASISALEIPKLRGRVTDLAGVIAPDRIADLDSKLADLERTDSTQVAVLTMPALEGESLEDISMRVVESWRLGQKGRDNGALLIVVLKERAVRIEVGYGLEATLTDARTRQIIEDEIVPRFRQGDYTAGIAAGVEAIIQVIRGSYQAPIRSSRAARASGSRGLPLEWVIMLLFPLFALLNAIGKWGGGIVGAGAGMLLPYSLFGAGWSLVLLGAVGGSILGVLLGAAVRAANKHIPSRRGGGFGGPFFWGGGGGFSGGGGIGGGGFSGGGGSFGGGGSSGSW